MAQKGVTYLGVWGKKAFFTFLLCFFLRLYDLGKTTERREAEVIRGCESEPVGGPAPCSEVSMMG